MKEGLINMNHRFFQNTDCEFFPCHKMDEFNCLFCFCPAYHSKECPGSPVTYHVTGYSGKDCSQCEYPHDPSNYNSLMQWINNNRIFFNNSDV